TFIPDLLAEREKLAAELDAEKSKTVSTEEAFAKALADLTKQRTDLVASFQQQQADLEKKIADDQAKQQQQPQQPAGPDTATFTGRIQAAGPRTGNSPSGTGGNFNNPFG